MSPAEPTTPRHSQHSRDTWCVIPVYNNAATIHDIAQRCRQQLPNILVVDDGSTDADLRRLLSDLDVTVIRHPRNLGKGAALLTAFRFAAEKQASYLITIDGDGQHYPEDIPLFLDHLAPDAILVGQRDQVIGTMPGTSRFGRDFSDFWIYVETGKKVSDTQSGFRAYPVGHVLKLHFFSRHYNFEVEVITRAIWAGLTIHKIPIRVWYAEADQRVSSFHPFRDNLRISLAHSRLVGRRLLPIPHRRLAHAPLHPHLSLRHPIQLFKALLRENATPLGLAAAAGVGIFLGALPLVGLHVVSVFYVSLRLHLNKAMALAVQNLCMPPFVPIFCIAVGYRLRHGKYIEARTISELLQHPADRLWEWLLGSLIVAPLLAILVAVLVYFISRRMLAAGDVRSPEKTQTVTITANEHR